MDEREFRSQVRRLWTSLSAELELGKFFIAQDSLGVDEHFRDVAIDPKSPYAKIYKVGLSRSHYNILLNDYFIFSFPETATKTGA